MDAPKRRRRWLRFSLRGLLIAVLLVSLWLGWRVKKVRDVDKAIAAVVNAGGEIRCIRRDKGPPETTMWYLPPPLHWKRILTGEGEGFWFVTYDRNAEELSYDRLIETISLLERLHNVRVFEVWGNGVTDASLARIANLRDLTQLSIASEKITDEGILQLAPLAQLNHVTVRSSRVTRDGIERLRKSLARADVTIDGPEYPRWSVGPGGYPSLPGGDEAPPFIPSE